MTNKKGDPAQTRVRARALKPELTEATDGLNKNLLAAEAYINDLKLGVRAGVTLEHVNGDPHFTNLVYGKYNDKWCLFIEDGSAISDDEAQVTPLMNATRKMRMKVADNLEALLEEIVKVASIEVETIQSKSQKVAEFIEAKKAASETFDTATRTVAKTPSEVAMSFLGYAASKPQIIKDIEAKVAAGKPLLDWEQDSLDAHKTFDTGSAEELAPQDGRSKAGGRIKARLVQEAIEKQVKR